MTRRTFVEAAALAGGGALFAGLTGCAQGASSDGATTQGAETGETPGETTGTQETSLRHAGDGPQVLFTHNIDSASIQTVCAALGRTLEGSNIAVKLSTGEPGSNYLKTDLIEGLVSSVSGTIVECNVAYGGQRSSTESHYRVAKDHGFTSIAPFQILDEDGDMGLPVEEGFHLSENLVGSRFADFDGMLVLSHFKGHAMAGFGGAIKNISIGLASAAGKCRIHTAGASDTSPWGGQTPLFQESMADAAQSVIHALGGNMLYVNVMNRLSVDCDCDGHPAEPKMADIGILASTDPVALDQACIDLVYASTDNSADLIARIESLDGEHTLEAAEKLGVGSRSYELVEIG